MHIDLTQHPVLQDALYILNTLEEAGHAAYFVGGAVRDVLLGRLIHDVDIATSATPEETMRLFPKTFATGLQHGTVTVVHNRINYEVTTFRVESDYINYRQPENVAFVTELKLDLSRRDFTMNAMAINTRGEVVDYFNGITAIEQKNLIAVGDANRRFQEDALRMMRAIRFATTFKFTCEQLLWDALQHNKGLLKYISMERVEQELGKIVKNSFLIGRLSLLYKSELLLHTKKKLHLQHVLTYYFEQDNSWLNIDFKKQTWFWAFIYYKAGRDDNEIREDLNALVFPKKIELSIRKHVQWLQFFDNATKAILNEQHAELFINSYSEFFIRYDRLLTTFLPSGKNWTIKDKVNWIIRFYWLEQLQGNEDAQLIHIKPLLLLCGFKDLLNVLIEIEEKQLINKVTELKLSGRQLVDKLEKEPGAWLKEILQQLYIAVNIQVIEHNEDALLHYARLMLD